MSEQASPFLNLGLSEPLCNLIEKLGYTEPTPVQAKAIPHVLEGRDVLVQAQTGSGKTASFALPILENIKRGERHTQCLVLAPTRELAIQVAESFKSYIHKQSGIKVTAIYGGDDYKRQLKDLNQGAHIVVGTPGRVMDHIRRGSLQLKRLSNLVLDEADEMLRMGFIDDVEWVLQHVPESKQMALFSATMPAPIKKITERYLKDAVDVKIKQKAMTVDSVKQRFLVARYNEKTEALLRILQTEDHDGVIVFARTREDTTNIASSLCDAKFRAEPLNGDISQVKRKQTIDRMKSGKINIIVATDVAARGIDIARVSLVVNYDMPFDHETYVHRIGRTGRAGRAGDAILFVTPKEKYALSRLEQALKVQIEKMQLPSLKIIQQKKIEQLKTRLLAIIENQDLTEHKLLLESCLSDFPHDIVTIAAANLFLSQGHTLFQKEKDRKVVDFDNKSPKSRQSRRGVSFDKKDNRRGNDSYKGKKKPFKKKRYA